MLVDGIAVSHPVQAWIECGELLAPRDLIVMADGLVRRKAPFATIADLVVAVECRPRHRGIVALRTVLPHVRAGADSAMESLLRLALIECGFPEPAVNLPIPDRWGHVIARGDLVWIEPRIILEYEGDHHRRDPRQFAIDIDRVGLLESLGWRVIRVDAALFRRRGVLIDRIRAAWRQSGLDLPVEVTKIR